MEGQNFLQGRDGSGQLTDLRLIFFQYYLLSEASAMYFFYLQNSYFRPSKNLQTLCGACGIMH